MKQQQFFKPSRREHGGILALGKRKSRRPLSTKDPIHLTLRSEHAKGRRSLLRHQAMIKTVINKASSRFNVRVYQLAICGNHLHFLARGKSRQDLQNFFRVVAGHIAQKILKSDPLTKFETEHASGTAPKAGKESTIKRAKATASSEVGTAPKTRRKFWALLIYSRLLTWGREFQTVTEYIQRNTLEALNLIAYRPRGRFNDPSGFS